MTPGGLGKLCRNRFNRLKNNNYVPSTVHGLTLVPFLKLLTLPVFWGPFGPQSSQGLPIHEYVTYLATDVTKLTANMPDR